MQSIKRVKLSFAQLELFATGASKKSSLMPYRGKFKVSRRVGWFSPASNFII